MKKETADISSRPHEQYLRIKFERKLAGIRIYYTVFCLAILFAVQADLQLSLATLMLFSSVALIYSFVRYFKPANILENRRFPPAADWLDLLFIAVLTYLTGGIRGIFFVAYAMPICGGIMRYGLKAGVAGYAVALGFTGLTYFVNTAGLSIPPFFYIAAMMGTLAFVAWMVGILVEEEWKLRDEIYLSSITDHLTGLYNSNYLKARVKEEIERCRRENTGFALSFIDLDNFKFVNDQHGHMVGDKVLKLVADKLAENTRKSDVLARYGGDEFILLMPGTGKEPAEKTMQRIEKAITASAFLENVKIGLSSGVITFPEDGDSLDKLLTAADTRMYEKKGLK